MRMAAGPIASSEFSRRSHNELVPLVSLCVFAADQIFLL